MSMPPEGPEVRRTADWLKSNIDGCVVRDVNIVGGRFVKKPIERLEEIKNTTVEAVRCRGKVIVIDFANSISAISTLGMSGLWTRTESKHAAIRLWCEKPSTRGMLPVYFVDQRRFGNFRIVDSRDATSKLDELGWDALAEPTAYGKVRIRALKYMNKTTPVCEVMLDQDVFAGCGNYLRAEALYRAQVDPWVEWRKLQCGDEARLCEALATVSAASYARGGATLETFYDGDGNRGEHVDHLVVYGRTHTPSGDPISRAKDKKGRTVWWVRSP